MAIKATPDYLSAASRHLRDANFLENEAKIFIENANKFYHSTIGAMVLDGLLERLPQ